MNTSSTVLSLIVNDVTYQVFDYERLKQKPISGETGSPNDIFDPITGWSFFVVNENNHQKYIITIEGRFGRLGKHTRPTEIVAFNSPANTPINVSTCHFPNSRFARIVLSSDADGTFTSHNRNGEVTVRLVTEKELKSMLPDRAITADKLNMEMLIDAISKNKTTIRSKRTTKDKARAGAQGGRRNLKCGLKVDLKAAVKEAIKQMRGPGKYKIEAACNMALRAYPKLNFPSGWRGLYHHVKKVLKARSK